MCQRGVNIVSWCTRLKYVLYFVRYLDTSVSIYLLESITHDFKLD